MTRDGLLIGPPDGVVICNACGRHLPAMRTRLGNWIIGEHRTPEGKKKCPGANSVRHSPA